MHTVANEEKYKVEIGMQIYNCMINETMIKNKSSNVVVYDIYPDKVNALVIEYMIHYVEYHKDDLGKILKILLEEKRPEEILVFKYHYESDMYETYEIPMDIKKYDINKVEIDELNYSITFKQIEYLQEK
jgi:hypothetical protein